MAARNLLVTNKNYVRTLKMNVPKKLNAWTKPMLEEIREEFRNAERDSDCKVLILTGEDPYYCAGVELSAVFKLMPPKKLSKLLISNNQGLFDTFLNFPKPIIVAVNGPAFGASATSATLCNAIIASEKASFLTPFARLGVSPEGCSSFHFPRLIGPEASRKMLQEDWKVSAEDAGRVGLVTKVVKHEDLMPAAQEMAEKWIQTGSLERHAMGFKDFDALREVNKRESVALAEAFFSEKFLNQQAAFLTSKGKTSPALVFKFFALTRPIWSRFL
jgi:peroxisomal 3,2-trans-enoyl-CoA isomerase